MAETPRVGQRYVWRGVQYSITRVARDGAWADIRCTDGFEWWTKRQPLPLPAGSVLVGAS